MPAKIGQTNLDLMNTAHISGNISSYEAARSAFFTLQVEGLDNLLSPAYNGELEDAGEEDRLSTDAENYFMLNVLKCDVPQFSVGKESYRRGNDVVNFATVPTWNDGSIVVDDVVGLDTKSILTAWLYLAYNPHTRKGGRMADYKKKATLSEYTQDYQLIRTWSIEGAYVQGIQEDPFDRENDGKRKMTATIVFDRAVMGLPSVEETQE